MSYLIKSTSGLIAVRLTDAGRKRLSQGQLNFSLFQLGDSEMCYDCYTNSLPQSSGINILRPEYNAQNISNSANERNKAHVKYPVPITAQQSGSTYGLLTPAHAETTVYNRAKTRGFFSSTTTTEGSEYSAFTNSTYAHSSDWCFPVSAMTGGTYITLLSGVTNCNDSSTYYPQPGDFLLVQYDGLFSANTPCWDSMLPFDITQANPYLWYQFMSGATSANTASQFASGGNLTGTQIYLPVGDYLPNWASTAGGSGVHPYSASVNSIFCVNTLIIPSGPMSNYYGATTPVPYWSPGSLTFENNCDISVADVSMWNMNINWTETVAGADTSTYGSVDTYGSSGYCGTKEYLGYNSNSGQFDTTQQPDDYYPSIISGTYIRDSFSKVRAVLPEDQKCIAILHYTNQTISNFYGEKFAMEVAGTQLNGYGEAKNFKICIPWLMWHKKITASAAINASVPYDPSTGLGDQCEIGQCFWVDPPGFNVFNEVGVQYIQSNPNPDMNDPGLRYYHLWDNNPVQNLTGENSKPNRVGKVWPDFKIITFDDEEICAALDMKSRRNWTLPMPKVELIEPGINCVGGTLGGVITDPPMIAAQKQLYVTYQLQNLSGMTTGLHCNYYNIMRGLDTTMGNRDISVQFGAEFPYLRPITMTACTTSMSGTGWQAHTLKILYQITALGDRPSPDQWLDVDVTNQIGGTHTIGLPIEAKNLVTGTGSYILGEWNTSAATYYNLHDYINIPLNNSQEPNLLQFGDGYFFFGNLNSDIMATIYEMRYHVTLNSSQFVTSLNPTWSSTNKVRVTEIGLFDNNKDLLAIGKLKSPQTRIGSQQYVIKVDF